MDEIPSSKDGPWNQVAPQHVAAIVLLDPNALRTLVGSDSGSQGRTSGTGSPIEAQWKPRCHKISSIMVGSSSNCPICSSLSLPFTKLCLHICQISVIFKFQTIFQQTAHSCKFSPGAFHDIFKQTKTRTWLSLASYEEPFHHALQLFGEAFLDTKYTSYLTDLPSLSLSPYRLRLYD